ncbi:Nucleic acid-binding, OB-fold [Sesbania bispinosa]|nr:Nucleic acid-binding, OB-fold [Sesbania bispinosa]
MVRNICGVKDSWRLKVRVVRLWKSCSKNDPKKGGRIQASIRKPMMRKFGNVIVEGEVYKMIYFAVVKNVGNFRATTHEFKLIFNSMTRVFRAESLLIPEYGLSLSSSEDIRNNKGESEFLYDMMGLLTAVSAEKNIVKDGKTTRLKSDVGLVNVFNTSSVACHEVDFDISIGFLDDEFPSLTMKEEFLNSFPRKNLEELQTCEEDGFFIVLGTIVSIIDEQWWYKLKLLLCDPFETATFVLFDSHCRFLLNKSCEEMLALAKGPSPTQPDELKEIVGKEILVKVEKNSDRDFVYDDDSYKVKKICDDLEIIEAFKTDASIVTPQKLKFVPKFGDLSSPKLSYEKSKVLEEEFPILTQLDFSNFEKRDSSSFAGKDADDSSKSFLEGMTFSDNPFVPDSVQDMGNLPDNPFVPDSVQDMGNLPDSEVSTISMTETSEVAVNDYPDGKKEVDNPSILNAVQKRKLRLKNVKIEKD